MAVGAPCSALPASDVGLMHALKAAMGRNPRVRVEKRDERSVERDGIRFVLSDDDIFACEAA